MSCHPPQRGISSLSLYSKHYLDGNVGGLAVGGWRGEEQVSGLCNYHHHHSLSQHWLSLGPHRTFGDSGLLDKSSLKAQRLKTSLRRTPSLSASDDILLIMWWGTREPGVLSSGSWTHQSSLCTVALHLPFHFYLSSLLHAIQLENQILNQPICTWIGRRGRYNLMVSWFICFLSLKTLYFNLKIYVYHLNCILYIVY